jgi:uncharacterized protein YegJ (DUF2314 family)
VKERSGDNSRTWLWIFIAVPVIVCGGGFLLLPRPTVDHVRRITASNEELQAAAREAQQSLPGFIKELQSPHLGKEFAIKGAFETPAGPEYLWVKDPIFARGSFTGILDETPMVYKRAKKGDEVTVDRADVFDWLIFDGDHRRGGFTDQVLQRQQSKS